MQQNVSISISFGLQAESVKRVTRRFLRIISCALEMSCVALGRPNALAPGLSIVKEMPGVLVAAVSERG